MLFLMGCFAVSHTPINPSAEPSTFVPPVDNAHVWCAAFPAAYAKGREEVERQTSEYISQREMLQSDHPMLGIESNFQQQRLYALDQERVLLNEAIDHMNLDRMRFVKTCGSHDTSTPADPLIVDDIFLSWWDY